MAGLHMIENPRDRALQMTDHGASSFSKQRQAREEKEAEKTAGGGILSGMGGLAAGVATGSAIGSGIAGMKAGATAGSSTAPGYGTVIGGIVGLVGGVAAYYMS